MSFPFIDFNVIVLTPCIHCSEAVLQVVDNTTIMFLCCINTGIIHEYKEMSVRHSWGLKVASLLVQDGTLRHPCRYFTWRRQLVFYQDFRFSVQREKKQLA
jgi:hypothetical protein